MNLLDQHSDRLVEYVVVVGHRNKLIPYTQDYIDDIFSSGPPTRVAPLYEDESIEDFGHEVRYKINDFYGGPETDQNHAFSKIPLPSGTPVDENGVPVDTHPRYDKDVQRESMAMWPKERIEALISERKRIQQSLILQLQGHMFEADVLDRYPKQDSKAFPFPEGLPLFCVPKGGLNLRKSPSIPFIYYFGCTMSDGGRLYGTCLTFQEELSRAQIRGLMRRMENEAYLDANLVRDDYGNNVTPKKSVWLTHTVDGDTTGVDKLNPNLYQSVKDLNPNTIPLEVLAQVRAALEDQKAPGAEKWRIPSLWTSHCICLLSHFPFLNQYRTFLTELYRLSLTPCTVPIEHLISTLVDDTPLPPPGKYAVQLNVGPWAQQYYDPQHTKSLINTCGKAGKGLIRLPSQSTVGPSKPNGNNGHINANGNKDDDDLLFRDFNKFTYLPANIIPPTFKHDLTQAIQQSFLHHLKTATNYTLEKRHLLKQNPALAAQYSGPTGTTIVDTNDPNIIPLHGFDHDAPPIDLCTVHTLSKDLLPRISFKQQSELKIQVLMHQQQQAIIALSDKKDEKKKDHDKDSNHGHGNNNGQNGELIVRAPIQSPTDLTFTTTHDLASHYPSADLYIYNQNYPPPLHFKDIIFSRPPPNDPLRPSSIHVFPLFWNLDVEMVITIIEALIGERKVLILSDRLSLLAPICEALLLLLYPFKWFHVYVPLLPKVLNAFLNAPMPYLIGTTTNMQQVIEENGLDDHVVVYLDKNRIHYLQEPPRIPAKSRQKLKDRLQADVAYVKSNTPKNHFNPKYADSAFTLSALPGDSDYYDDADPIPDDGDKIDDFLYSDHPAASTASSKATHKQSKQSAGSIDGEIRGRMWDAEYNIKGAFFKTWLTLFYQTSEQMVAPIDHSTLQPKESITYPLVSAKYTRVCLQPEDFAAANKKKGPPMLDTMSGIQNSSTPLQTPVSSQNGNPTSFFTPPPNTRSPPPPPPPPPAPPSRPSSLSIVPVMMGSPANPISSLDRSANGTHISPSQVDRQTPLLTWAEDDFTIVSLTHPSRSLTHFTTTQPDHQSSMKSQTKSTIGSLGDSGFAGLEEPDDENSKSMFKNEAFLRSTPSGDRPFFNDILQSQAFARFIDERSYISLANQNVYHVLFWAEQCIQKKARQGVFKSKAKPTPFLDNKTDYVRQGCIMVSPPLGLHRGHQHYTQYHPFYSCTCHYSASPTQQPCGGSTVFPSLPAPFTTCDHRQGCLECDCLHYAVSKDHERLLGANHCTSPGLPSPIAASSDVFNSTSSNREHPLSPTAHPASPSTPSFGATSTHRNTIVHRPTLSTPSLSSIFSPLTPNQSPLSTTSPTPISPTGSSGPLLRPPPPPPPSHLSPSTSTPPPLLGQSFSHGNIGSDSTHSHGAPPHLTAPNSTKWLPGGGNPALEGHCPLLHEVFHAQTPFISQMPIQYPGFPRLKRSLFPDTIGRVPRLITIDGAQVLTFLRLKMGLIICFGNCAGSCSGHCGNNTHQSLIKPSAMTDTSTDVLLSPYSSLLHSYPDQQSLVKVHESTIYQVMINPGAHLVAQHQHHIDVLSSNNKSQQTFSTHTLRSPNAIQYIPINAGDTAYLKDRLKALAGEFTPEFAALQLDKAVSFRLAFTWTNVQTDTTEHIVKLNKINPSIEPSKSTQHASCIFLPLESIAPKLHHPLGLSYSCLDTAIRDPLGYSLDHYKNWISTWHKRITIPDSTSDGLFPHSQLPSPPPQLPPLH